LTTHPIPLARPDASSPLTTHRKSLNALTGIRFFAAMQVVFFHFGGTYAQRHGAPRVVVNFLSNGWIAVTLFFILSGFILSYNYVGQVEKPGGKRRFWEARFARIYPVYVLSLLLSLPFVGALPAGVGIAVLTMVQAWNPEHPEYASAWNSTAWTLSIEAFFYLVFPFLLPRIARLSSRVMQALLGVTVAVMVLGHTMTHSVEQLAVRTFIPVPVFRFPEFFAGMLMGLLFLRGDPVRRGSLGVYASLIALVAILGTVQGPWLSLIVIPYTILIYEMAAGTSFVARLLGQKAFVLLGGASYAIYLLQIPIRSWVHFAATGTRNLKVDHAGIDALLSPFILIGVSIAAFLFWEEPARRRLRSWFKRHTEPRLPEA
jgi:peptidoglycan/LPS O-acetylase OafA/YrhL